MIASTFVTILPVHDTILIRESIALVTAGNAFPFTLDTARTLSDNERVVWPDGICCHDSCFVF